MNLSDFPKPDVRQLKDGTWFATTPKWGPAPLGEFGETKSAAITAFYDSARRFVGLLNDGVPTQ